MIFILKTIVTAGITSIVGMLPVFVYAISASSMGVKASLGLVWLVMTVGAYPLAAGAWKRIEASTSETKASLSETSEAKTEGESYGE